MATLADIKGDMSASISKTKQNNGKVVHRASGYDSTRDASPLFHEADLSGSTRP